MRVDHLRRVAGLLRGQVFVGVEGEVMGDEAMPQAVSAATVFACRLATNCSTACPTSIRFTLAVVER